MGEDRHVPAKTTVIYCPRSARPCGVYDHAVATASAIARAHSSVAFRSEGAWGLVLDGTVRTVHAHYPSVGFGWGVWPVLWLAALRAAGKRVLLTIHEYEAAHVLRRLYIRVLASVSDVVFTPCADLRAVLGTRARRVMSGSNIELVPVAEGERGALRARWGLGRARILGFFGFSKTKGYDRFLDLARRLPADWQAFVIGGLEVVEGAGDGIVRTGYLASQAETSRCLQLADVFFCPYPDGLSERRGSFWAALAHGVPVIAYSGPQTTDLCRGPGILLVDPEGPDPIGRAVQLLPEAANGPKPRLPDAVSREAICATYLAEYERGERERR